MIKNFTIGSIYKDTEGLYNNIKQLEFKDGQFGEEIPEFQMLPNEMKSMLNSFSPNIEVSEESGFFRKPYNVIHCENVPQGRIFVGFIALSSTKITFYKHNETESENAFDINVPVDEVLSESIFEDKWTVTNTLNVKQGDLYFFNPALWHKIESDLVQVFYMNVKEVQSNESE